MLAYSPEKQNAGLKEQGRSSRMRQSSTDRNKQSNIQVVPRDAVKKVNQMAKGEVSLDPYQNKYLDDSASR